VLVDQLYCSCCSYGGSLLLELAKPLQVRGLAHIYGESCGGIGGWRNSTVILQFAFSRCPDLFLVGMRGW
jgi:predicted nucleic acid-binding Zn finger protein